tara:strand:- start:273 stop:656 length:384 start_codon:yes stop_codon:yes gene_type:complete
MNNFLKTIKTSYRVLLEQEPPPDAALPPDAAMPPQTPDQVDQTTEIEQTGNDANKILLVNIIKNLINLTISALSTVGDDYSQEQKETEKLSAQNKISKLNQVINTINTPDMKLNDIIAMVDNSIKLD